MTYTEDLIDATDAQARILWPYLYSDMYPLTGKWQELTEKCVEKYKPPNIGIRELRNHRNLILLSLVPLVRIINQTWPEWVITPHRDNGLISCKIQEGSQEFYRIAEAICTITTPPASADWLQERAEKRDFISSKGIKVWSLPIDKSKALRYKMFFIETLRYLCAPTDSAERRKMLLKVRDALKWARANTAARRTAFRRYLRIFRELLRLDSLIHNIT